jgi:hypothetical protein
MGTAAKHLVSGTPEWRISKVPSDRCRQFIAGEIERWAKVVKAANMKPE